MTLEYIISVLGIFALTVVFLKIFIPILKSHKLGQVILEIGPRWQKNKNGTPIMGGICFIFATLIVSAVFTVYAYTKGTANKLIPFALTIGFAVANAIIGFIDDYTKLIKKQNEGLKVLQKLIPQFVIAALYVILMVRTGLVDTTLHIPFTDIEAELGIFYYIAVTVFIVAIINSTNLTDGIDGLLSAIIFVMGCMFTVMAFTTENISLSMASSAMVGSSLGFLVYNFHPARIFMGDTGSLFWGGFISGVALMISDPLILIFCAFVCIFEELSVVLQVSYFKITHGKRLFLMAPFHHSLEKRGWGENKIVFAAASVTLVGSVIGWIAHFA